MRQKDRDARRTRKHGRSFFGYKNHVNADAKHRLIRHYAVTDAAVHDSQELHALLHKRNTRHDAFADRAYPSAQIETTLRARPYHPRIHDNLAEPAGLHEQSPAGSANNRRQSGKYQSHGRASGRK